MAESIYKINVTARVVDVLGNERDVHLVWLGKAGSDVSAKRRAGNYAKGRIKRDAVRNTEVKDILFDIEEKWVQQGLFD